MRVYDRDVKHRAGVLASSEVDAGHVERFDQTLLVTASAGTRLGMRSFGRISAYLVGHALPM